MGYVRCGGGMIVGNYCESAGHRFDHNVAKGLAGAGEKEDVRGGVMFGQRRAGLRAGEQDARLLRLQGLAFGAVAKPNPLGDLVAGSTARFQMKEAARAGAAAFPSSALAASLQISAPPAEVNRDVLLAAMKEVILDSAELKVVYTRPGGSGDGPPRGAPKDGKSKGKGPR